MSLKTRASGNNQRAREAMLKYNLHEHDIKFMLDYFEGYCAYCGIQLTNDIFQIDHIIPITEDNIEVINYGSVAYNCVPSCQDCNQAKGTQNFDLWIKQTFENPDEIIYKLVEYQTECGISELIY